MKKLPTTTHLQDFLDQEHSWRIKEIANFKLTSTNKLGFSQTSWIRAAVPLLYAHWEGFVKNAATAYLSFVDCQGRKYDELESCLVVFGLKNKINVLISSKKASVNIAAVDFLRSEMKKQANLKINNSINTQANLSSSVFENIAFSIGIETAPYETRYNLIDKSLLERRNRIAHGEYLDLTPADYRTLADEILTLLRQFKDDILNAAVLSKYIHP
jgi:RiboL-PSP-HEPN